jgi:hypothetical protein
VRFVNNKEKQKNRRHTSRVNQRGDHRFTSREDDHIEFDKEKKPIHNPRSSCCRKSSLETDIFGIIVNLRVLHSRKTTLMTTARKR